MLKKITLILCAALLVGAFAQAATKSIPRIEGTIESVNGAKNTLTVQAGTETKTFQINDKTTFMMNGKHSNKIDLKAGENVSIEADAKNVARLIDVKQS